MRATVRRRHGTLAALSGHCTFSFMYRNPNVSSLEGAKVTALLLWLLVDDATLRLDRSS